MIPNNNSVRHIDVVAIAGAPVLVAYHWKHDLEHLLTTFPHGRHLDQDPQLERRKDTGLFAYPASAGSRPEHAGWRQHTGIFLALVGSGAVPANYRTHRPIRQIQAGHNRPVFIHHIIAADTMDEMVMERRNSKRTVQDILLDAMKNRGIA